MKNERFFVVQGGAFGWQVRLQYGPTANDSDFVETYSSKAAAKRDAAKMNLEHPAAPLAPAPAAAAPQCSYCGEEFGKCVTVDGRKDGVCVEYAAFWTYEAAYQGL